jgi:hypothetical protein
MPVIIERRADRIMPSNDQRYHGQGYEGGSGEGQQCFHHQNLSSLE